MASANDNSDEGGITDSPKRGLGVEGKTSINRISEFFMAYETSPTLSTSTSSFEALDPHDPNLSKLATAMFEKTSDYLIGELTLTQEDYKLLEAMNKATAIKYTDMKQIAQNIGKSLNELNAKYECLRPMLEQIDQIEDSVTKLEQAAYKLDNYSKRLEAKFKALEKR